MGLPPKGSDVAFGVASQEPWVSIDDVAVHVGVRKDSIYRWIERRGLPAAKVGKLWKLKLSEVDAWMREQQQGSDASGKPATPRARSGTRSKLVLVIDDEHLVRDTVSDFLIDEGHRVQIAVDGDAAMALLATCSELPELLILDLKMPHLDGWRFRERQLRDPRLARIPVVVVTAVLDADVAGTVILKKPLRLDDLASAMAQVFAATDEAAFP